MVPIATTVAGLEPLIAAKSMHARTPLIAMPPGTHPMKACANSIKRWLICPLLMTAPLMMKNGIASRVGLSARLRMPSMMIENWLMCVKPLHRKRLPRVPIPIRTKSGEPTSAAARMVAASRPPLPRNGKKMMMARVMRKGSFRSRTSVILLLPSPRPAPQRPWILLREQRHTSRP